MQKHTSIGIIYGFITLLTYLKSDYTNINFIIVSVIISWLLLLLLILTIQWFDKTTDIYFLFVILFFMTSRLAKTLSQDLEKPISYISIGIGLGLVVQCCTKGHVMPVLLLLGIFAIEICNIELDMNFRNVTIP